MGDELKSEVQASVFKEYERAYKKFGKVNNSNHESYAVILEEFEEAQDDMRGLEWNLRSFWGAVRADTATKYQLQHMRRIAENAAGELIQVAAMCYKAEKSMEG